MAGALIAGFLQSLDGLGSSFESVIIYTEKVHAAGRRARARVVMETVRGSII